MGVFEPPFTPPEVNGFLELPNTNLQVPYDWRMATGCLGVIIQLTNYVLYIQMPPDVGVLDTFGGPKTEPQEVRNRPHVTTGAPERVRQQRRAEEQRSALLDKLGLEEMEWG